MPTNQPTISDLHVNQTLTNISVAYTQDATNFIADRVFPNIPVEHQSDQYWKYKKGTFFRMDVEPRAPGTPSAGTGFEVELDAYYTPVYALHHDVPDQVRANADSVFSLDRDATMLLTGQVMLMRDQIWANRYFRSGVWTRDITGVSSGPTGAQTLQWDQSAADPIEWVDQETTRMLEGTGRRPNTLVIGPYVLTALKHSPSILDRIKYTQRGILTEELLASMFGVDRVLIARATQMTGNEATQGNPTLSFVFGKSLLLCHSAPAPGLMVPSAGYTFSWTGYLSAGNMGSRIKKFRMEEYAADRVEIESAFEMKIVSADLGTFVSAVVA
jgi:hypothetical protein